MTAIERAQDLFTNYRMSQLPPMAYDYMRHLARQIGACGEVMLTAYAAYAELVEGCEPADAEYAANADAIAWFNGRRKGVPV